MSEVWKKMNLKSEREIVAGDFDFGQGADEVERSTWADL